MLYMTTTTTRPTQLHYRYATLAGQLLATLLIGLVVLAASLVSHYGNAITLNEGYVLGGDTSAIELGLETRGTPGMFGHLTTPLGTLDYVSDAVEGVVSTWCPAGATDAECGA